MKLPKPWLRQQNQTWYVQINGKQVNLGRDREKAFAEYHRLMHLGNPDSNQTVRQVIDAYWQWAKRNLAESTLGHRENVLKSFGLSVPATLKASQLKPYHVQHWIESNSRIKSPTTVSDRITLIQTVFNWAKAMGYVTSNPIESMPKPRRKVRQEFVPAELWQKVLDFCTDESFRDYLVIMLSTGARPQEMNDMEARHFDGEKIVFPIDESKGRKKSRVIYLPPEAHEVIQRLAKRFPEGALFRNSRGNPWDRNSVRCRFRRLKKKLEMPNLCATTLRHSYAHYRLSQGQDSLTVAKLMGHVDTRMVATRYGHLEANQDYMQKAANQTNFPIAFDLPSTPQGPMVGF